MARRRRKGKKKSWAHRVRDEFLAVEGHEASPRCSLHDTCGGCTWQDLRYESQLQAKRDHIAACFETAEIGHSMEVFEALHPSPDPYRYRNQMEFSFAARRWLTQSQIESDEAFDRDFALGLHAPGGFDRVLDVPECHIQSADADAILQTIREHARASDLAPYDSRSHEGFWRYANLRVSRASGEVLVYVVTAARDEGEMERLDQRLLAGHPAISTIANGVTDSVADTSVGAEVHVDHGPGLLVEVVNGLELEVTPGGFFQPNSTVAEALFAYVVEHVPEERRVLDLFCGSGAISLHAARKASTVFGFESFAPAVAAADRNAARNGITNTAFGVSDLEKGLPEDLGSFDCIISDPPRVGMHKKLVSRLAELCVPRIISVGCNPKSQAENLAMLMEKAPYRITKMRAFDQFPHTPHVENIAILELES